MRKTHAVSCAIGWSRPCADVAACSKCTTESVLCQHRKHIEDQISWQDARYMHNAHPMLHAHLLAQVPLPELAICSATGHCAQEVWIDLNHLLDRLRSCVMDKKSQVMTACDLA